MAKGTIPAVLHPLLDISIIGIVACDNGSPESRLTIICAMLTFLFDSSFHFVLVGDLNVSGINRDTLFCSGPFAVLDVKFVTLVQDILVFQHVRAPTRHKYDAPPTLLDVIMPKDDSNVSNSKLEDPVGFGN